MSIYLKLGSLAIASLLVSCKASNSQSTEEGIAANPPRPTSSTYDINNYLNDPQLRQVANSNQVQTWLVPKHFGGGDGELHVCIYANNVARPGAGNGWDGSNTDIDRFASSVNLKGGKYINWSKLFQVLNDEKNSGRWNPLIAQTFADTGAMLKEEKEKLKRSLRENLEDMTVLQPKIIYGWDGRSYYADSTEEMKVQSQLAGLLLTLDRTPTTENDCPSTSTLVDRARGEGNVVIVVQPAPPVQMKIPTCSGDQALVNHNRGNGWVCEGSGAYTKYGKNCKDSGNGYFRENAQGDIADRNTWKCMKP